MVGASVGAKDGAPVGAEDGASVGALVGPWVLLTGRAAVTLLTDAAC